MSAFLWTGRFWFAAAGVVFAERLVAAFALLILAFGPSDFETATIALSLGIYILGVMAVCAVGTVLISRLLPTANTFLIGTAIGVVVVVAATAVGIATDLFGAFEWWTEFSLFGGLFGATWYHYRDGAGHEPWD
jgi:hypothetical protein